MNGMVIAHLILLAAWGGLVAGETVVEFTPTDPASRKQTAVQHFWMDILIEFPLLLGVLFTGGALIGRFVPLQTAMQVKIACGAGAVLINLYCLVLVILRYRKREDDGEVVRYNRKIRVAGAGVPLALIAAYLGLTHYVS